MRAGGRTKESEQKTEGQSVNRHEVQKVETCRNRETKAEGRNWNQE